MADALHAAGAAQGGATLSTCKDDASGRRRQFTELYRECSGLVRSLLLRHGIPAEDLADQVHGTFLVAWRNWTAFRGESKRSTWLLGIAKRVAIAYFRTNKRGRLILSEPERLEEYASTAWQEASDTERQTHLKRQWAVALRVLGDLPAPERAVLELTHWEGRSIKSAGAELGLMQRQTYTLRDRALTTLRRGVIQQLGSVTEMCG